MSRPVNNYDPTPARPKIERHQVVVTWLLNHEGRVLHCGRMRDYPTWLEARRKADDLNKRIDAGDYTSWTELGAYDVHASGPGVEAEITPKSQGKAALERLRAVMADRAVVDPVVDDEVF